MRFLVVASILLASALAAVPSSAATLTTLFNFDGPNGSRPTASLIADASGTLYGTTYFGGPSNLGTVFSLSSSGAMNQLVNFSEVNLTDGSARFPYGGVIVDASGTLYGTTSGDAGVQNLGTVFSLSSTGALTTLVTFNGANGRNPFGDLIADTSGTLYGTTGGGGALGSGTVFSLSSTGTLTTLASFFGADGIFPEAGLIADASGTLYGTTAGGGAFNAGTVFSLNSTGTLTTLVSFDPAANGSAPSGGLFADALGTLYGTLTVGGTGGRGTLFKITGSGFDVGAAAVPEPQSWALLILGFGLIGGAARRRRTTASMRVLA